MFKKKIIFFGTKNWDLTNQHLQYFIKYGGNLAGLVIDRRGSAVTTVKSSNKLHQYEDITSVAKRLDIPIIYSTDINSVEYKRRLQGFKADVFIVCGYQFFLPEEIIKFPGLGTLNFHSSLLPRHAGRHPGFWTIWYGDRKSGITVHHMDSGIDTGDIAYQSTVPVITGDSIETLYNRIWDTSPGIIKQMLADLENDAIPAVSQNYDDYFYNYEITDKDFELDFRYPASVLFGRVRMMPGRFYFLYKNEKFTVNDCEVIQESFRRRNFISGNPEIIDDGLFFMTPRGSLKLLDISKEGEKISPLSLYSL
jgi:methionyl-tRNA formyltransferase